MTVEAQTQDRSLVTYCFHYPQHWLKPYLKYCHQFLAWYFGEVYDKTRKTKYKSIDLWDEFEIPGALIYFSLHECYWLSIKSQCYTLARSKEHGELPAGLRLHGWGLGFKWGRIWNTGRMVSPKALRVCVLQVGYSFLLFKNAYKTVAHSLLRHSTSGCSGKAGLKNHKEPISWEVDNLKGSFTGRLISLKGKTACLESLSYPISAPNWCWVCCSFNRRN